MCSDLGCFLFYCYGNHYICVQNMANSPRKRSLKSCEEISPVDYCPGLIFIILVIGQQYYQLHSQQRKSQIKPCHGSHFHNLSWHSAVERLALVLMRCSAFFQEEDLSGLACGRWSRFALTDMRTASDLRAVPSPPHHDSKTARKSTLFA